ncbi:uncharacterized protein [Euwallacea similis]|uniref:uncharacterized protein n=1 Tax=Euwallacea similis TaxID=1736056 RepID=UPI003450ACA1
MDGRDPTSPPTHFSVHAEFTISHPGADDPRNRPCTSTERDETTGGVRMTYSWGPRTQSEDQPKIWPTSVSNSNKSIYSDTAPSSTATLTPPRSIPPTITPPSAMFDTDYTRGFQKGNMFFTSTPPPADIPKDSKVVKPIRAIVHDSSGYGSDLLSPNSQKSRAMPNVFDRKCRSTCNITLSTNAQKDASSQGQCARTQSLRCQTPSSSTQRHISRYYGCGDPWCHHLTQDECQASWNISPVPEEPCVPPAPSTTKKDVSVQTFEMVDKCTSPFMRTNSGESMDRRYQRRGFTEPLKRLYSPGGSFTPDSLEGSVRSTKRTGSKLHRMPAFDAGVKEPPKESSPADSLKKPRTVHIDVYCTGTEMESNASSDSSDEEGGSKSASTPQTVFENEKMRVTHKKGQIRDLPFYLRRSYGQVNEASKIKSFESNTSADKEDSDEDNASTAYPSKLSSYSNIGDLSASMSSVPRSWTTYSLSSCAIPEDYDSVANTSWKDTFSDIDSLMMSRSSIAPTESLDFVPRRRIDAAQSIDEAPEYERKNLLETPSIDSIQPSDSFEYANSEDRLRIRQMEDMWRSKSSSKSLKSPMDEQSLKRMQEYLDQKVHGKKWESKDSDSNDSEDSGKAYTFVKGGPIKEETPSIQVKSPVNVLPNTVRNALVRSGLPPRQPHPQENPTKSCWGNFIRVKKEEDQRLPSEKSVEVMDNVAKSRPPPLKKGEDQGSLSDSSISSHSPSNLQQRLSLDPTLRSPFMIVPGIYTEPRSIARKFGTVVSLMKKPGHHVGPAKNPDCMCDHCQSYWQGMGYRGRTRSMGDPPTGRQIQNWKEFLEQQQQRSSASVANVPFTDL